MPALQPLGRRFEFARAQRPHFWPNERTPADGQADDRNQKNYGRNRDEKKYFAELSHRAPAAESLRTFVSFVVNEVPRPEPQRTRRYTKGKRTHADKRRATRSENPQSEP